MNTEEFKWGVNWQQVLKSLIEDHQDVEDEEAKQVGIIISYFPAEHAQFLYSSRCINMYYGRIRTKQSFNPVSK